jgi:hypothetical protein
MNILLIDDVVHLEHVRTAAPVVICQNIANNFDL